MMEYSDFKYKVTVIVPVYNVAEYLERTLQSLMVQTIDANLVEVLLIDDGSSDDSLNICMKYSQIYPMFKVFSKENEGVSATRNLGIQRARGKYIFFLDADDTITKETLKAVTDFFDSVYDSVDLVTYKLVSYRNGKAQPLHYRHKFLTKSGVYDLAEVRHTYCSVPYMNIIVKNNKSIFFDTALTQGEDQKFITENLIEKMKIGYCDQGEYHYIRREDSAMGKEAFSLYLFEQRMELFECFFEKYDHVPPYIQGIVLANWYWELKSDCIFPYHYKGEKRTTALKRLQKIIDSIDVETIKNHPQIDSFHKHFLIASKKNISPTVFVENNRASVIVNGNIIYQRDNMEIILRKVTVENDNIEVLGIVKSPIFNYINEKPGVFARWNNGQEKEIHVFKAIDSHYKTKASTNYFYGFRFEDMVQDDASLVFFVTVDGIKFEAAFYIGETAVFNKNLGIDSFVRENHLISLHGNEFQIKSITDKEKQHIELSRVFSGKISDNVKYIREIAIQNKERIWLYCDSANIKTDNAFYQFQHDWGKNDGIKRYYVCDGELDEEAICFDSNQKQYVITYGSTLHKILYLCSEYVLCSFIDQRPRLPFAGSEFDFYRDLKQPVFIYLQHGVLHADLRYTQSSERCKIDKIVVSSEFEKNNYIHNYHYREKDIISVGMARFDLISKEKEAKSRILFAPSWRLYLANKQIENIWNYNDNDFMKSNYFQKFMMFLTSERLINILEKYDLYLDAKLHQNLKNVFDLFHIESERIKFVENTEIEDYKIFITDISSFVFDFAYLNRPVFYFMPDMEEFESGMHSYRKLDLPFEEAFGNLVTEPDDAVQEIERIIERNYIPEDKYRKRMEEFFIPMSNCREKLYQYLMH